MERLSGLDASFLYIESPTVPLHVCSIVELDMSTIPGGYIFDRFHDDLASRIKALPEFRAKLADTQLNLDHPVWVEDKNFDLSRHLSPLTHAAIHNVIISNVAGPDTPLYALGAEIKGLYLLGPIFHSSGLNITVMSLSGKLNVGIISCRKLVDDLWGLADRFEIALDELLRC